MLILINISSDDKIVKKFKYNYTYYLLWHSKRKQKKAKAFIQLQD